MATPKLEDEIEIINLKLFWGDGFPTKENHTKDVSCTDNDCINYRNSFSVECFKIVGIKKAPYFSRGSDKYYALMMECKKCFRISWYHISKNVAEGFNELDINSKKLSQ